VRVRPVLCGTGLGAAAVLFLLTLVHVSYFIPHVFYFIPYFNSRILFYSVDSWFLILVLFVFHTTTRLACTLYKMPFYSPAHTHNNIQQYATLVMKYTAQKKNLLSHRKREVGLIGGLGQGCRRESNGRC